MNAIETFKMLKPSLQTFHAVLISLVKGFLRSKIGNRWSALMFLRTYWFIVRASWRKGLKFLLQNSFEHPVPVTFGKLILACVPSHAPYAFILTVA